HLGLVDLGRQKADGLAAEQVGLDKGESDIGGPFFILGAFIGPVGVVRFGFGADEGAVAADFGPEGFAGGRRPGGMWRAAGGIVLELGVVEAAGENDFLGAIGVFGGDPGDIGTFAGQKLAGGLGNEGFAVGEGGVFGQGLEDLLDGQGLAVGEGEAKGAFGHGS